MLLFMIYLSIWSRYGKLTSIDIRKQWGFLQRATVAPQIHNQIPGKIVYYFEDSLTLGSRTEM